MCGIFSLFNFIENIGHDKNNTLYQDLYSFFMKGYMRGPEYSILKNYHNEIGSYLGFHRLAINGLDEISHQPIEINKKILICNGEIYNYKEIYETLQITPKTHSDCESIIYLYEKYGIKKTLQILDGVFAFVLIDMTNLDNIVMHIARDPFGVRPLYKFELQDYNINNQFIFPFGFCSEMKMVIYKDKTLFNNSKIFIKQFTPGTYSSYYLKNIQSINSYNRHKLWYLLNSKENISFYNPFYSIGNGVNCEKTTLMMIRNSLENAVLKRVTTTDRPIACLLSGGLDSSLITSLVHKHYSKNGNLLETYSIGMEGSEDLKYAKMVADYLGTKHTEIVVSEREFLNAIPEVIYAIESYDTTSIRASVGNYLVSKYISQHSDAKVIFNGDGSDEVCGGYMYFHCAPNSIDFDNECKRLLSDICYFDVLRSDRSISSNGLEPRTPFLDKGFVQTYLSICKHLRFTTHMKKCEKYLLRKAFDEMKILPYEVLWRTKEAFSDGVSKQTRSWYQIIQEYVSDIKPSLNSMNKKICDYSKITHNIPSTLEQEYYRELYHNYYGCENDKVIPYFWMPRFIEGAKDASARTLDIYKKKLQIQ
jgi:asparagine synthase (glutamine-hydrolysing)